MDAPSRLGEDRYEVRGLLGEGAQGITYDAVDLKSGRPVAIKRFDVRGARSWKDVELAEREARVLATLDHPLVPRYIEHFEENGQLFLVMEKVDGQTLEELRRNGPIAEGEVRRFLADADRALTYLHGRGSPVVHRDLKPRNVIRRPDGSYVLVDFGAVTELMLRKSSSTVVGTYGYMAPEQFQGRALPTTDIYAVGATALAALTGVEPDTLPHKGLRLDVHAALDGRASPAMIAALEEMLEPDPDRRAKSLGSALDGVRGSDAPPAYHRTGPPPPPYGWQPPPQHRSGYPLAETMQPVPFDKSREDAQVKSIRSLLWALWGIGWAITPVVLHQLHLATKTPVVMLLALVAVLIVTWHKGAVIRALIRQWKGESRQARATAVAHQHAPASPRRRVEVVQSERVRVHTTELRHEEIAADTQVQTTTSAGTRRASHH